MIIDQHVSIAEHSSMKIGGTARYFTTIESRDTVPEAVQTAAELGVSLHAAGEGTNTIFADGVLSKLVVKIAIPGFETFESTGDSVYLRVGAGENWDSVVERAVAMNLSGIEALTAIPGSSGAAPIQNIGAYGREIKDILVEVKAFDQANKKFVTLTNEECMFGYRKSIFNSSAKGNFIVTSMLLKLSNHPPAVPDYSGVKSYFSDRNISSPSLHDIRNAIREIRTSKLPDPSVIPNCGSFFKNPIVSIDAFEALKTDFPDMPSFPAESGAKIPAGWLIEKAGLKGKRFGTVGTYEKNALVLVNLGGASFDDLVAARDKIRRTIREKFEIELEQEPEVVE